MEEIVFNAENSVAGRAASIAAKELLKGRKVSIVNAEKSVVMGNPKYTIGLFKEKVSRGDPYKGPFYPKRPDRILKRMVRGMVPYKKPMGKRAFRRLRVYISVPEGMKEKELKPLPAKRGGKFITLGKLAAELRGEK
jgi:large subunit ribosomal protein L13